jgi:hypothetical protein
MERSLYSKPNEGQLALPKDRDLQQEGASARLQTVRLENVLRNFWIGETSDLRRGYSAKLLKNGAMAPQLSVHWRARTWAISGAVVAFTVVVGVNARASLLRSRERWPMELIASRNLKK